MPQETQEFIASLLSEFNTKLRDLEEKQRLLKERILLIGKNLVEIKESSEKNSTELKIGVEEIKQEIEKLRKTLIRVSEELEEKARKSELNIIEKQIKMFQPFQNIKKE